MSYKYIGFAGFKRSGKDTAASMLLDAINNEYKALGKVNLDSLGPWGVNSFAAPLKGLVKDLFGFDEVHTDGYLKEVPVNRITPTGPQTTACVNYWLSGVDAEIKTKIRRRIVEEFVINSIQPAHSYRIIMQVIGTDIIRRINPSTWVDIIKNNTNSSLIIPDVRFPNEAKLIRDNGILVHIRNNRVEPNDTHITEAGLEFVKGDLILDNSSCLKTLETNIKNLLPQIKERLI